MFDKPTQNANIVHVRELGLILHGLVHSLETKKCTCQRSEIARLHRISTLCLYALSPIHKAKNK